MPLPLRREHLRIVYDGSVSAPRLILGDQLCVVLDCSERGLRYRPSQDPVPALGIELRGRVRFPSGEEVRVHGVVLRIQDGEVVLALMGTGIPFRIILNEHLRLQ